MAIKMIALDVDGCLNDGKIVYSESGGEVKAFNVKDGLGIVSWIRLGRYASIITGRSSKLVDLRAKELGINRVYQGVKDKGEALKSLAKEFNLELSQIAVIGDDLNDYPMIKIAGESFAPYDANPKILEVVNYRLTKRGGDGAVREMIEILLKKEGLLEEFYSLWSLK